jgi:hypothetical protein
LIEGRREEVEAEKRKLFDVEEGSAMLGRGVRAEGSKGRGADEERMRPPESLETDVGAAED